MLTFNDARSRSAHAGRRRKAIVTLETIIWLPVLAILLAAVIEMGLLMTGTMHVAAASRLGAKLAAENAGTLANPTVFAGTVKASVDAYLANAGFGASEGVRIQHTIGGGSATGVDGTCPEKNVPPLPTPDAVRVVVCVNATTVAPNALQSFGFNLIGVTLEMFTTYPYEL